MLDDGGCGCVVPPGYAAAGKCWTGSESGNVVAGDLDTDANTGLVSWFMLECKLDCPDVAGVSVGTDDSVVDTWFKAV